MCNAHFQHLFDDTNLSSSSPYSSSAVIARRQQRQHQQHQATSPLALHPHTSPSATSSQDSGVSALSPVSTTSGWTSYPMDTRTDVQMYSPASATTASSYSSFHSPIDTNTRAYALAGALQQQQQQQHQTQSQSQSGTAYPESSQRSTDIVRGAASGHGSGQQFFPEIQQHQQHQQQQQEQQQMTQRWGYAGHAHAHPHGAGAGAGHDFPHPHAGHEPSPLSMSRAPAPPILDAHAQTSSTSDSSAPPSSVTAAVFPSSAGNNVSSAGNGSGARLSMSAGGPGSGPGSGSLPDSTDDRRLQGGARQVRQSLPHNNRAFSHSQLQHDQHQQQHRAMASHHMQQQQQQQHWHAQAHTHSHSQQTGPGTAAPFLQVPTPRAVNMAFFPYAGGSGGNTHAQLDYENESDDFGEHEEFDEAVVGLEEDDASGRGRRPFRMGALLRPSGGSPTPELQYPQDVSGVPSDNMRANFMLYGSDPSNWPIESVGGGFSGPANNMGTLMHTATGTSGTGFGLGDSSSSSARINNGNNNNNNAIDKVAIPPEFFRPSERREKGKRASQGQGGGSGTTEGESDGQQGQTVKVLIESSTPGEPPKKVKMHQCRICQKLFPRPSGLATHMNSHSGARPFKCPLALCPKTFAVRSNARRHLRTHGITVPPNALNKNGQGRNQEEPFQVGFETPVVIDVHDPSAGEFDPDGTGTGANGGAGGGGGGGRPPKLRWVPPSLATRTNAGRLRSLSPASDMADIDGPPPDLSFQQQQQQQQQRGDHSAAGRGDFSPEMMMFSRRAPGLRIAPAPLPPAVPTLDEGSTSDIHARFDERNSYAEAGTYPYHPEQWRCLPGPGLVLALRS